MQKLLRVRGNHELAAERMHRMHSDSEWDAAEISRKSEKGRNHSLGTGLDKRAASQPGKEDESRKSLKHKENRLCE